MSDPRNAPSILTRGAVDLGALRSAPPPAPSSAGPDTGPPAGDASAAPGASASSGGAPSFSNGGGQVMVIDVTEATFADEVLTRSMTTPVVIDFWAEWCGPCKQLSPVLEHLAHEGGGSWVLAKVDVDANPRLAATFRIQSIPTVYAVVGGQPVDAFNGVIPEAQLRQWIAAVMQAGGVAVEQPDDPRFAEADDALVAGDLATAEAAYRKILADAPADAGAEAGLAQVDLLRRVEGQDPTAVLAAADAAPDDIAAQTLAADVEVLSGDAPNAYARLVDLVRRTAGAERDAARAHLISLFTVAGPDDPAVVAARRALASALF
ncbi:MAG TPA: thioredoxin [Micromonosporaceae bacterium]|nr:thioredoxin [Micromonosporaceae bacterium]